MMEFGWQIAFITVLIGGMYTSYKIGFKEGTGRMIDFCRDKSDKRGYTLMHFFGNNIEFVDPLSYNKTILDKIVEGIEKDNDEQST
tara:strand:+ start:1569 stop:1826 length:258 start_codon:yes stop_codon:yes gene_type:complete